MDAWILILIAVAVNAVPPALGLGLAYGAACPAKRRASRHAWAIIALSGLGAGALGCWLTEPWVMDMIQYNRPWILTVNHGLLGASVLAGLAAGWLISSTELVAGDTLLFSTRGSPAINFGWGESESKENHGGGRSPTNANRQFPSGSRKSRPASSRK